MKAGKTTQNLRLDVPSNEYIEEQVAYWKDNHEYHVRDILEIEEFQDDFMSHATLRVNRQNNDIAGTLTMTTTFTK